MGATNREALRVGLLGELRVAAADGTAIPLPASRKARALLAYLVLTGRRQRRQHLCDLLWDEVEDPRAAMRWSLSRLRSALNGPGEQRLESDRISVGVADGAFTVDLFEARELLGERVEDAPLDRLRRAAALFRGELLEGLDLLDAFRFHSWCVGERESARSLRVSMLRSVCARAPVSSEALKYAYDLVAVDPLDESAQTEVIRLLVQEGRQLDAEEQLRAYKRALEIELGVVPSEISKRLRELIRDRPTVAAPARAPERPAVVAAIPLVGRDDELERFEAWLALPHTPMALLSGDPGLGKTRLMEAVGHLAARQRAATLSGRAYAAETGRALGPWRDALAGAERSASVRPVLPSAQEPLARSRIFDELLGVVAAQRGDAHQLVIFIDDLQWLDEASAAFLHFVARRAAAHHILLVCAVRPAELIDNPAVQKTVETLRADAKLFDMPLGALAANALEQICGAIDESIDSTDVVERSEGNPFFAVELARALSRGETTLPENTRRVVEGRLHALSEGARDLLPWAASLGRTFHIDVLERVTKLDSVALVEWVGELEDRGVFEPKGSNAYDFTHDLVRDAAYRQLSGPRRRMVHRSIARSIDAWKQPTAAITATELLRHAELGQEQVIACRASIAAAAEALNMSAWVDACNIADRGLQHTSALDLGERLEAMLELLRCRVQAASLLQRRHPSHIIEALAQAAALDGSDQQRFEFTYLRYIVHRDHGDTERANSDVQASERTPRGDPESAARLIAQTSRCLVHLEREVARARSLHVEAVDALRVLNLADVELHWSGGLLAQWDGDLDVAVERLESALALARENGDRWREASCTTSLMKVCLEAGQLERVIALAERPFAFEDEGTQTTRSPFIRAMAAIAAKRRGQPRDAELNEALDELRERGANVQLTYLLADLARCLVDSGELDDAEVSAKEAASTAEAASRTVALGDALVTIARIRLARGDESGARDALTDARQIAEKPDGVSARIRRQMAVLCERLDAQ